MLVLFILYMIFFAGIYAVELGVKLSATRKNSAVVKANALRVTEPFKVIAAIFAITVIELIIAKVFGVITAGFIRANNIFFGIAAAIYSADYVYEQIKLKDYDRILINAPYEKLSNGADCDMLRKTQGSYYARKFSSDYLNLYEGEITDDKRKLIKKIVAISTLLTVVLIAGIIVIAHGSEFVNL